MSPSRQPRVRGAGPLAGLGLAGLGLALACGAQPCGGGEDRAEGRPAVREQRAEAPAPAREVPEAGREPAPGPPLELAAPLPRPVRPEGPTFLGRSDDELIAILSTKVPVGARGTPGTSLSTYVNLEGPVDGAFKPRTKSGQRWAGEVVAYRLARLLEIGRVPPSVSRRFRLSTLRSLLADEPAVLARLERLAVVEQDNTVVGAMSYWVPEILTAEVEREEQLERWTVWLRQGKSIPPDRLALARQLSDSIAFDYVTGNWDRWSGGNVLLAADGRTLLLMDNNAAFNVRMSEGLLAHLELPLGQVERWSAGLYRRLVALSAEDLRAELAEDPEGPRLLTEAQVDALLRRRDRVVGRIERQIEQHGHDAVLCFP